MLRYFVGIDLGTTNTAVASALVDGDGTISTFAVPQVVESRGDRRPVHPALVPAPADRARGGGRGVVRAVGGTPPLHHRHAGARTRGRAAAPPGLVGQVVALSHRGRSHARHLAVARCRAEASLDEEEEEVESQRVSPVDASARYLAHLRAAWNDAHPDAPLDEQDVFLTVPASFDAVARELTVVAAQQAGLASGHPARGAAGGVLRLAGAARRRLAQAASRPATSSWSATSAAAPPTSR